MLQLGVAFALLGAGVAQAQPPAPATSPAATSSDAPTGPWTGNVSFGLALNRGNTSTTNVNASFDVAHNLKSDDVWKFHGLYLRGSDNRTLAVDRLDLEGRDERTLTERTYGFGQLQFVRDKFKDIDYLWAPSAGVGYKVINAPETTLNVDGGLGLQVEQYTGLARHTDAVVTASEKLDYKLSPSATVTQGSGALWKVKAFGDALYTISAGIAAAVTTHTELKAELLDTYASRPPTIFIKSNDAALLTAIVYKF
jgi:putative salt-induced outer membrane protein